MPTVTNRGKHALRSHFSRERAALVVCLSMILAGLGISGASAASRYNSAPVYVQEQSNWCWAATTKSVVQYYRGVSATQCKIVQWGKGTATCANVTGYFGLDVSRALTNSGISGIGSTTGVLSFDTVRGEIDSSRVALIRWGWDDGSGHMLLLRGYNTSGSIVGYINPLNSSYQSASYSWLVNGGTPHHVWTDSRYQILA